MTFERVFPLVLSAFVGFALVGVGSAIGRVPGPYWLGFFGTLIGSATSAGVGILLIREKDRYERQAEIGTAKKAIESLIAQRQGVLAVTGGDYTEKNRLFLESGYDFLLSRQADIIKVAAESLIKRDIIAGLIVQELGASITTDWKQHLQAAGISLVQGTKSLIDAENYKVEKAIEDIREICQQDIFYCERALSRLSA